MTVAGVSTWGTTIPNWCKTDNTDNVSLFRMPAKTGGSHAFASFVTLVVGTMLSKYIWNLAPPLGEIALLAITGIRTLTGAPLPVNEEFAGTVVVMVAISFVWGVVYHLGRHDYSSH